MRRKVYWLLDYVARIINTWKLEDNFIEYLMYKLNKGDN